MIQASGSFDIIDMGEESQGGPCFPSMGGTAGVYDCPDIEIEHLSLSGNGTGMGIVNCCAQELSRVNDVSISNVTTGLALNDQFSENSGPYTNLTISAVYTCLSIGPAITSGNLMINSRGVHGLTCSVTSSNSKGGAITIDGPDNELEDITVSSATPGMDGIFIGSQGPAEGNTLINIQGVPSMPGNVLLANVIHISNNLNDINTTPASAPPPATYTGNCANFILSNNLPYFNNVCDLTIFGVTGLIGSNTLRDDITNTTITDLNLAMYALGEDVVNNAAVSPPSDIGYSRFSTAAATTNTTPWLVGATAPSGSCAVGGLYSCTGSNCTNSSNVTATLWQCVGGSTPWQPIQ